MPDRLAVWMYGLCVATIEHDQRRRLRLRYADEAFARYALGTPLLSLRLPLAAPHYPHGAVSAFLDGLLPEGDQRRVIADELDLKASDTYGLVRALGRDCAGALVILPEGGPPSSPSSTAGAQPLSDDELGALVANLRSAPLGVGETTRLSLAGVQEKLVLTRMPGGAWGLPMNGAPSTHILKPEIAAYPDTVENEAFCMRLAKHLGLDVAHIETAKAGGRKLIVVERYDRIVSPGGQVERVHQEDFCQALGIPPQQKYEEDGGPTLRRIAGILDTAAGMASLEALLRALVLNVVLGNGDAHGKNFSLLHGHDGGLRLAPLYDVMSTLIYGQDRLAMSVDAVERTSRVTADRILNEAASWGLSRRRAGEIADDLLQRVPAASAAAEADTEGVPAKLLRLVRERTTDMRETLGGTR